MGINWKFEIYQKAQNGNGKIWQTPHSGMPQKEVGTMLLLL